MLNQFYVIFCYNNPNNFQQNYVIRKVKSDLCMRNMWLLFLFHHFEEVKSRVSCSARRTVLSSEKKEVHIHIIYVTLNKNTLLLFLCKTSVTVVEQIDYFC